jgi:hypothetical protein
MDARWPGELKKQSVEKTVESALTCVTNVANFHPGYILALHDGSHKACPEAGYVSASQAGCDGYHAGPLGGFRTQG